MKTAEREVILSIFVIIPAFMFSSLLDASLIVLTTGAIKEKILKIFQISFKSSLPFPYYVL